MACFRSTWLVYSNGCCQTNRWRGLQICPSRWPSRQALPDIAFQDGLQAGTWTFQKHSFVTDSDPHGSKSGSEGIPWQLFSSRISWQAPNPAIMSQMGRNIKGFGSGFSDFSDFPQMENRDLGWIGLGLGSPKTLFSVKKHWFLDYFWPFSIIWGFPLGGPPRFFLS